MARRYSQRGLDYRYKEDAISAARKINPKKYKVKIIGVGGSSIFGTPNFYGVFSRRKM